MATPDTRPSASPATHHGTRTHRSRLLSLLDSDADEEPGIGACRSSSNHHDPRPIHSPSVSGQHSLASAARHAVLLATTVLAFGLASAAYAAPLPGPRPGPVPVPVPVPAAALAISPRAASTSASGESASSSSSSDGLSSSRKATYGIVVPILIVLSGIFAGLTLGYMSLDETQLAVLAAQGTPKQQDAARKIMPIRKDGHLLLTTLLIANMITNEVCPSSVLPPSSPNPPRPSARACLLTLVYFRPPLPLFHGRHCRLSPTRFWAEDGRLFSSQSSSLSFSPS